MPIRTALWKVSPQPQPLSEATLASERALEDMIVAAPNLLSDEWMLIGRQEDTGYGGRVDLLAIAPDGGLVMIELKRERTPREVVAQALDYASWVEQLRSEDLAAIYGRFKPGRSLSSDFQDKFGQPLDEESLNQNHQIVVVAASLDDSSERIVNYLNERDIAINVLCFQVFANGNEQLLSRAWLLDPVHVQANSRPPQDTPNEPWNGESYCSFGEGKTRSWEDAVEFGFICAGGGSWYVKTLEMLIPGDRVWVKVPGVGFVGVGRVTGKSLPASRFTVTTGDGEIPILDAARRATYNRAVVEDPVKCEYFVPISWLQTVPVDKAVWEVGLFGNQNTVCKPTGSKWRSTVERLKVKFTQFDR